MLWCMVNTTAVKPCSTQGAYLKLDMLGITDKNVGGNSNYTKKMYSHGIFDEVETEYNTLMVLKRW